MQGAMWDDLKKKNIWLLCEHLVLDHSNMKMSLVPWKKLIVAYSYVKEVQQVGMLSPFFFFFNLLAGIQCKPNLNESLIKLFFFSW